MIGSTLLLKAGAIVLADSPGNPCPKAPPGLKTTMGDILSYIKYGTLWSLFVAFFASLAIFTAGRIFDHRTAGRAGSIGMAVVIVGAALYGTAYAIVGGIAGKGC
jgi:hypothetical protein